MTETRPSDMLRALTVREAGALKISGLQHAPFDDHLIHIDLSDIDLSLMPQPRLIDRGHGLMYDRLRDITWLQDTNYARSSGADGDGQMTWDQAMSWVRRLEYRGIKGWRLPTAYNRDGSGPCIGDHCHKSELGHMVHDLFGHASPGLQLLNFTPYSIFWTSTEAGPDMAYGFKMSLSRQGPLPKNPWNVDGVGPMPLADEIRAWPVHDGDVGSRLHRVIDLPRRWKAKWLG
jgi:hypothetical protein